MKLRLSVLLFFLSNYAAAQTKLSGILEDASTKEKIQFAHISFQNSSIGTSSNADGYFELSSVDLSEFDSIQISHISYQTRKISIVSLALNTVNSISLLPDISILQDVLVLSKSPYEYLINALSKAKENLKHPFSSEYYYREIVKDNEDYSKYSDAVLTANFPVEKEQMQVGVEEARVINLPMESDDVLDIISPIDVSRILEFQYLNFLDRFLGEKKKYYDFHMKMDAGNPKKITYEISPVVKPEKNTLLYYGWLLTEDDNIKHVKIQNS